MRWMGHVALMKDIKMDRNFWSENQNITDKPKHTCIARTTILKRSLGYRVGWFELDSCGSGYEPLTGFC
jgi:hypothetical protein